jgi:hypothetical protein
MGGVARCVARAAPSQAVACIGFDDTILTSTPATVQEKPRIQFTRRTECQREPGAYRSLPSGSLYKISVVSPYQAEDVMQLHDFPAPSRANALGPPHHWDSQRWLAGKSR